jgi:TonB family protein
MTAIPKKRQRVRREVPLLAALALICFAFAARAEDRKVQKRVQPVYPELARRMHITGVVRISATVAPDGSVTEAKAVSGNSMLSLAAEDAVKKWKFVPSDAQSTVDISFNFETGN